MPLLKTSCPKSALNNWLFAAPAIIDALICGSVSLLMVAPNAHGANTSQSMLYISSLDTTVAPVASFVRFRFLSLTSVINNSAPSAFNKVAAVS